MSFKLLGAAAIALLGSACAHSYPDLATFENPELQTSQELGAILAQAQALQADYSSGYKATARRQDLSQLPIVGAAAAGAWILLKDKEGAAKKAGKIGIGTLAYSNARDQLFAKGMPEAYIAGHAALTCVLAEGSVFHGSKADQRLAAHSSRLQDVANSLHVVTALRNKEPSVTAGAGQPNYAELLKAARTLADQAMAAARTAEATGLGQEAAFETAPPIFRHAISTISVRVATKGRVRDQIEFNALRDAMGAPKTPSSTDEAMLNSNGVEAELVKRALKDGDSATIVQALAGETSKLMEKSARLAAATPNYSKSLDRVREDCVKLAP